MRIIDNTAFRVTGKRFKLFGMCTIPAFGIDEISRVVKVKNIPRLTFHIKLK